MNKPTWKTRPCAAKTAAGEKCKNYTTSEICGRHQLVAAKANVKLLAANTNPQPSRRRLNDNDIKKLPEAKALRQAAHAFVFSAKDDEKTELEMYRAAVVLVSKMLQEV